MAKKHGSRAMRNRKGCRVEVSGNVPPEVGEAAFGVAASARIRQRRFGVPTRNRRRLHGGNLRKSGGLMMQTWNLSSIQFVGTRRFSSSNQLTTT